MPKKKNNNGPEPAISDYRHKNAKRKNIPPAKIAAEGTVPPVPKIQYSYSPRRSPELRFDPKAGPDKLPLLLQKAVKGPLTETEAQRLAEALRSYEPWLEWAGKLEQNRRSLEVDPVALHIHERVSAQAILKVAARQDVQRDLFADPQQSYSEAVQFYKHEIGWANRMILGDSLQVMASLAQREDLAGKVQMIYMDPPYGIRFASNFQPEIGKRDVKDKETDLTREPETVKAYRDTWTLGVHSYLAYLRARLVPCRELLADTGSIFVQISDENLHRVRILMDEVFGDQNFCGMITFKKTTGLTSELVASVSDYILWYCKTREKVKYRELYVSKELREEIQGEFKWIEEPNGSIRKVSDEELGDSSKIQLARLFRTNSAVSPGVRANTTGTFEFQGLVFDSGPNRNWKTTMAGMRQLAQAGRLLLEAGSARIYKQFWNDFPFLPITNHWADVRSEQDRVYVVQTSARVVERCMLLSTDPGDLVFDPTCGSGTTAYVAEQWGRRWITTDTSRVALSIARQRLLTSKYDFFELKDADKGVAGGFRCRTVAHISLKSIAHNSNLHPIFAKYETLLDAALARCNITLKGISDEARRRLQAKLVTKERQEGKRAITDADRRRWQLPKRGDIWRHREVPFDSDSDWPEQLQDAVRVYRSTSQSRMDEINACIAANAEQEELVDSPVTRRGVIRVSGPFTLESVQPPEISLTDRGEFGGAPEVIPDSFEGQAGVGEVKNIEAYLDQMVKLLRADGVRFPNNKHMNFTRLVPISGIGGGVQAEGRWVPDGEKDDDPEAAATVAVAFGPQYGPVSAKQVEDMIRTASRRGYDALVVAGFSFDGAAQATIEEASHPKLRIHMAHIRPDVNPGMAGLLKETPNSQLFSVFGQPRTSIAGPDKEGNYLVRMEGVDIYDPVTNTLNSTANQKVAAWFIDGDYDGRTFCITQAFFPDKSAWEQLSKALNGVVDPGRFESLSGTTSLPFPAGPSKCVAVKAIDPRGNEVMAVHKL